MRWQRRSAPRRIYGWRTLPSRPTRVPGSQLLRLKKEWFYFVPDRRLLSYQRAAVDPDWAGCTNPLLAAITLPSSDRRHLSFTTRFRIRTAATRPQPSRPTPHPPGVETHIGCGSHERSLGAVFRANGTYLARRTSTA